jgi:hypothetical protein
VVWPDRFAIVFAWRGEPNVPSWIDGLSGV